MFNKLLVINPYYNDTAYVLQMPEILPNKQNHIGCRFMNSSRRHR